MNLYQSILDGIEQHAISGDGTGINQTGLLHASGTTVQHFSTDLPTTLRGAVTKLQNLGEMPTGSKRQHTRAAERTRRILEERALNDAYVAERNRPPPF